jgi:glyoxylase-like metal-dependent hydrolase (beta-lactamase superfamily II)
MPVPDAVHVFPQTLELDDHPDSTINPGAVETDRGLLLIDAGFPGEIDQVEANLDDAGFDFADVWGVVLTHQDPDHAGGLADVVERADPVVFAHPTCAPYVDGREFPVKLADERYPAAPVHVEVTEGTRFDTQAGPMEVVFTPGHAPGHISLHLPEAGFLASGDALHAPEGELDGPRFPMDEDEAVESVRKLGARDFDGTLTQHGGVVDEGADELDAVLADRDE